MAKSRDQLTLGIDGCRGGWLVAGPDAAFDWLPLGAIAELLADCRAEFTAGRSVAVAIDMPIGLPEIGGRRPCDSLARKRLPGRASTIFPAPPRAVLNCRSYSEARAMLSMTGGPNISAQTWGIVPAIRALDEATTPADELWLIEAHPELAFTRMAGTPLAKKTSPEGKAQRLEALGQIWPDLLQSLGKVTTQQIDERDALAMTWTATRHLAGQTEQLTEGKRDTRNLLMRIVH